MPDRSEWRIRWRGRPGPSSEAGIAPSIATITRPYRAARRIPCGTVRYDFMQDSRWRSSTALPFASPRFCAQNRTPWPRSRTHELDAGALKLALASGDHAQFASGKRAAPVAIELYQFVR